MYRNTLDGGKDFNVSQRFFFSSPITQKFVALAGDEGHHLARVMRAKPGDRIVLFDGGGAEFDAQVTSVGRTSVDLEVLERREVDRECSFAITLGVALPKGDRQRFLVEKAVELGVGRLVPLETRRGVAQPTASALERLERAVIEASKQCGRNRLMEVAEPVEAQQHFADAPSDTLRLLAHPGGEPLARVMRSGVFFGPSSHDSQRLEGDAPRAVGIYLAVGPEGGFTDEEAAAATSANWRSVDLGPRIVRVETAALALAAWCALADV